MDFYIKCIIAEYAPNEFCLKCGDFICKCIHYCVYDDFYDIGIGENTSYLWYLYKCKDCYKKLGMEPIDSILYFDKRCEKCEIANLS